VNAILSDATYKKKVVSKYIIYTSLAIAFVVSMAIFQSRYILGFDDLDPVNLIIPFIVGSLFGLLISRVGHLKLKVEEYSKHINEIAVQDPLTGLSNRRFVYEFVTDKVEALGIVYRNSLKGTERRDLFRIGKYCGLFMLDIDYFKKVNDTHGHQIGDLVLKNVAARLKKLVRLDDVVTRWGGEEFLIILVDTKPEFIPVFADRLNKTISEAPIMISNTKSINITVSVGGVRFPIFQREPDVLTFDQSIALVDEALYFAKENGRNRVVCARENPDNQTALNQETLQKMMSEKYWAMKNKLLIYDV
jgi:diguanylate cyclase (GGDEF)-like protein